MVYYRYSFAALLSLCFCLPFVCADDDKPKADSPAKLEAGEGKPQIAEKSKAVFKATCPVSGSEAKKDVSAKYRDKVAYFCCEKCKAAFEAEPAKYAEKANFQLVQTRQFRQTKCPVSGGKVSKEQAIKVNGVNVAFCCEKCKGSLESASKEEQLTKIFGEAVFTKSFAARKADGEGKAKQAEKIKKAE